MDKYTYSDDEDDSVDRLSINVGGVKFETYVTTLQNIPDTRLAWLTENVDPEIWNTKEFFFDRHPGAFVHILNFYRTGKLHTPTDICGPAFEEELTFWGIDEKQMEPCCWESFTKHREAEGNLRNFEGPGFEDLRLMKDRKTSTVSNVLGTRGCLKYDFDRIWYTLDDPHFSTLAKRFSILSCLMIIISVSAYCLSTIPQLSHQIILHIIDYMCLVFFTLEIIARIIVTPDKREFVKNYKNWIDFISVMPSYLLFAFPSTPWIKNLVIIRILRVFKFFKLSYGLQVMIHTLKASSYELTLLLLILLIPVVVFSSLVYAIESAMHKESKFDSVPRTFWWCIITMTTVGYGDLVPVSWPGQIVGSICSICGLLIVALPISVIGSNFTLYYAHVRARLKLPKKNRALLQGNLRGLLRQPLSLSSRDRDRKSLRRNNNVAIRRKNDQLLSPESLLKRAERSRTFDQISNHTVDSDCVDTPRSNATPSTKYLSSDYVDVKKVPRTAQRRRAAILQIDQSDVSDAPDNTSDNDTILQLHTNSADQASDKKSSKSSAELEFLFKKGNLEDDTKPNSEFQEKIENSVSLEQRPPVTKINHITEQKNYLIAGELILSQTLFSPKPQQKKNKTKQKQSKNKHPLQINNTSRSRRGALVRSTQESSSDENDTEYTDAFQNNKKPFKTQTHAQDRNLNVSSDSELSDAKRRISMKMLTSFDDICKESKQKIPLCRSASSNSHRRNNKYNNYVNNRMKCTSIEDNQEEEMSDNNTDLLLFSDHSSRSLCTSHTERRPKKQVIVKNLDNKIHSEGDIFNLESSIPQNRNANISRQESGV